MEAVADVSGSEDELEHLSPWGCGVEKITGVRAAPRTDMGCKFSC